MEAREDVRRHWSVDGIVERLSAALAARGKNPENFEPGDIAAMDHLHSGGLPTTRDQAAMLALGPGTRVLDLGCGIGGPARFLASTYGCFVAGIDLSPAFVAAARELTRRCGLADKIEVREGDACALPYGDAVFDVVWCQNVTMNIADKPRLLAEVHRVLKPGGLFTYTEHTLGPAGEPHYPTSWARTPAISFLVPPDEMRSLVEAAGFRIRDWVDYTGTVLGRARASAERAKAGGGPANPNGNRLVYGPGDIEERQRNTQRSLAEGRLVYVMVVAERAD